MGEHDLTLGNRPTGPAYDEDWAAWLAHQVELLKAGRYDELDREHLIDEVESLGRSEFRAFVSAIEVVLLHLLKWDYQPQKRTLSWPRSIDEHRDRVAVELGENPSYASRLDEALRIAYRRARARAASETLLPVQTFPEACPYDWPTVMTRVLPEDDIPGNLLSPPSKTKRKRDQN